MVHALRQETPDPRQVLAEATLNAARGLGLSQQDLQAIIGKHPSNIRRHGIDPDSKSGELALLLVRLYRSLYVLIGGDSELMRHWLHTHNRDTGAVPAEQVRQIQGLAELVAYLDALRGMP